MQRAQQQPALSSKRRPQLTYRTQGWAALKMLPSTKTKTLRCVVQKACEFLRLGFWKARLVLCTYLAHHAAGKTRLVLHAPSAISAGKHFDHYCLLSKYCTPPDLTAEHEANLRSHLKRFCLKLPSSINWCCLPSMGLLLQFAQGSPQTPLCRVKLSRSL